MCLAIWLVRKEIGTLWLYHFNILKHFNVFFYMGCSRKLIRGKSCKEKTSPFLLPYQTAAKPGTSLSPEALGLLVIVCGEK